VLPLIQKIRRLFRTGVPLTILPAKEDVPSPETVVATDLEIGHVLFMDIVKFSLLAMERQAEVLDQFQRAVGGSSEFQRARTKGDLISLPTGDGMALVFFRDPVSPVVCALEVASSLQQMPGIKVRMGVHSGPVYRIADINTNRNVVGGGINVAQRVMACGGAGHILISKPVADILAQLESWRPHVHDLGEYEVKHSDHVHLYNLYTGKVGNEQPPSHPRTPVFRPTTPGNTTPRAFKYYLYISDAKVNMLFPQVPYSLKKKMAEGFGVDVNDLNLTPQTSREDLRIARLEAVVAFIEEAGRMGTIDEPLEYLAGALAMAWGTRHLVSHRTSGERDTMVYLAGKTAQTIVGLGGSAKHLIGVSPRDLGNYSGMSRADSLELALRELLAVPDTDSAMTAEERDLSNATLLDIVEIASRRLLRGATLHNLEFTAKRLLFGPRTDSPTEARELLLGEFDPSSPPANRAGLPGKTITSAATGSMEDDRKGDEAEPENNILLASPLYVALVE
jgi:class 3 adenylate cyclase